MLNFLNKSTNIYRKHTQENKQFVIFLKKKKKNMGNNHIAQLKCPNTEGCWFLLFSLGLYLSFQVGSLVRLERCWNYKLINMWSEFLLLFSSKGLSLSADTLWEQIQLINKELQCNIIVPLHLIKLAKKYYFFVLEDQILKKKMKLMIQELSIV